MTTLLLLATSLSAPPSAWSQEPPFTPTSPAFFAIQVEDAEASADWYVRAFGLGRVSAVDMEERGLRIRILSGGGMTVEVIEARAWETPSERHRGLFKAGLFVSDIHAAHEWFLSRSPDADSRVLSDPTMGMLTFVIRDPDGNRIQLFQEAPPAP